MGAAEGEEKTSGPARDFIFEPDARTIFEDLLPRYAAAKMLSALANAMASEQGLSEFANLEVPCDAQLVEPDMQLVEL